VYEIDLCAVCLATVQDEKMPTRLYPHGTTVAHITHVTAQNIMRGIDSIVISNGTILPMVALATVQGTRVCGDHINPEHFPWA
jgi:hypothetical protein